ncbi:MAG: 50S ribosomal protein L24 [Deltaproteobacteria bacterium]|nr:MAG: 50S ribosomal protein L24 [Deltaproteobacteria bacterium]
MTKPKLRIRRNDIVKVIKGKDRGKVGKVIKVIPEKRRVIVEKVNIVKRHVRPSAAFPQGGILEKEASISVANVMLMCDKCNQPTRVGYRITEAGEKFRYCKKCGEVIEAKKK